MFIDLNGVLYDFFNGEDDLKNNRIRFVGDVAKRLQEDYLRIFRYFRFHSRFGQPGQHDQATINTMGEHLLGLNGISGERIWSELKRIFTYIPCQDSVHVMFDQLDIGKYLGFGDTKVKLDEFDRVHARFETYPPEKRALIKPQTMFASLVKDIDELARLIVRLKLSNQERFTIHYILNNRTEAAPTLEELKQKLALEPMEMQPQVREFIRQHLLYIGGADQLIEEMMAWPIPKFPSCAHLIAPRVRKKAEIAKTVRELKNTWAMRGFAMSESEIQLEVDAILERLRRQDGGGNK